MFITLNNFILEIFEIRLSARLINHAILALCELSYCLYNKTLEYTDLVDLITLLVAPLILMFFMLIFG